MPDNAFDLVIADPPYGGANNPTINGGGEVRPAIRQVQGKHIKLNSSSPKDRMYKYRKLPHTHTQARKDTTMQLEDGLSVTKDEPG